MSINITKETQGSTSYTNDTSHTKCVKISSELVYTSLSQIYSFLYHVSNVCPYSLFKYTIAYSEIYWTCSLSLICSCN